MIHSFTCAKCGYHLVFKDSSKKGNLPNTCPRCTPVFELTKDKPKTEQVLFIIQQELDADDLSKQQRSEIIGRLYSILIEYVKSLAKSICYKKRISLDKEKIQEISHDVCAKFLICYLQDENYRTHSSFGGSLYFILLNTIFGRCVPKSIKEVQLSTLSTQVEDENDLIKNLMKILNSGSIFTVMINQFVPNKLDCQFLRFINEITKIIGASSIKRSSKKFFMSIRDSNIIEEMNKKSMNDKDIEKLPIAQTPTVKFVEHFFLNAFNDFDELQTIRRLRKKVLEKLENIIDNSEELSTETMGVVFNILSRRAGDINSSHSEVVKSLINSLTSSDQSRVLTGGQEDERDSDVIDAEMDEALNALPSSSSKKIEQVARVISIEDEEDKSE